MKKNKLDLFSLLKNIDEFNIDELNELSEDDLRQASSYMILRWMSCSNDRGKINRLATLPNKIIFNLKGNPMLAIHLLASCASGEKEFYTWKKKTGRKQTRPVTSDLLKEYYNMSKDDAIRDSELMDMDSMVEIAEDLGRFEDIPKLGKEFDV
jgi:hypothetical protein